MMILTLRSYIPRRYIQGIPRKISPTGIEVGNPYEGLFPEIYYSERELIIDILNIIHDNERAIVSYLKSHNARSFSYEKPLQIFFTKSGNYPLMISAKNLAPLFGMTRKPFQVNWLDKLVNLDFISAKTEGRREFNFRKIAFALNKYLSLDTTNFGFSLALKNVISKYIEANYLYTSWASQFFFILDEYTKTPLSGRLASELLGFDKSYLSQASKTSTNIYTHYNSLFNFSTSVNILDPNNQLVRDAFKDITKLDEFKQKVSGFIYDIMVQKGMIGNSRLYKLQFEAISQTLYALTKARTPTERHAGINQKNPQGFFTIQDLSIEISPNDYSRLIADELRERSGSPLLMNIISDLSRPNVITAARQAKIIVRRYIKKYRWTTSTIGTMAHPILEYLTIQFLKSKGVLCSYEILVNYPMTGRVDNIIFRDSKFILNIENPQSKIWKSLGITIPSYIKSIVIDFTHSADTHWLREKLDKNYQSNDRYLFVVVYGGQRQSDIDRVNQIDWHVNHRQHISIVSIEQYVSLLGMGDEITKVKSLSSRAFESRKSFIELLITSSIYSQKLKQETLVLEKDDIMYYIMSSYLGEILWDYSNLNKYQAI